MIGVPDQLLINCAVFPVKDNKYISLEKAYIKNVEALVACNSDKEAIRRYIREQKSIYEQ